MAMAEFARNQTLAFAFLPDSTPIRPQTLTLHLHSGDPGNNGVNEITDASYTPQAVTFTANTDDGAVFNTDEIIFPAADQAYSVSFISVQDENNNVWVIQQLSSARNIAASNSARFASEELIIGGAPQ